MRRVWLRPAGAVVVMMLLRSAGEAGAQPVSDTTGIGALAGVVVDAADSGLAGVQVALMQTDYIGTTNTEGAFLIPNIPAGRYVARLIVAHEGRRGVYPELFPVEVLPGAPSGVIVRVSRAAVEDSLVFAEDESPDDAAFAALSGLGIETNERIERLVREGLLPDAPVLVQGRVFDAETRRWIPNAEVSIEGISQRRVSDAQGRFAFGSLEPGRYTLSVSMLGYAPRRDELIVLVGSPLDVRVELARDPIALEPIVVEARSTWLARVGFYDRRDDPANFGRILTRRDFENRNYSSVVDVFHGIAGAHVEYGGLGGRRVRFRRVVGTRSGPNGCSPSLYLDGARMTHDWEYISPEWIEAMEVYVGGARAPIQYSHNPCGAVLIWTRRGG